MPAPWAFLAIFMLPLLVSDRRTDKPDFSGSWRFSPQKSRLQIPQPTEARFQIEHREPAFHLTRTLQFGDKGNTISLHLTTDGKASVQALGEMQARIRVYWDGSELVLDSIITAGGNTGTNLVRYSLQDEGRTFVARESFRSKTHNYDNLWVFDRCDNAHNPA
jgi:hypothetical protein